jgi:hypothetical protein
MGLVPGESHYGSLMVTFHSVRWVPVLGLAIVAVVGAGCDRPVAGSARPASNWHPPTTTTPAPTTTTVPTVPATAADGNDYATCATRTCEVSVSGPVDIRIGGSAPGTLSIKDVTGDAVDFTLSLDDGESADGTLKPGCDATTVGGGGMSGSFGGTDTNCSQAPTAVPGSVTFEMPAAANGVAIIWIAIA